MTTGGCRPRLGLTRLTRTENTCRHNRMAQRRDSTRRRDCGGFLNQKERKRTRHPPAAAAAHSRGSRGIIQGELLRIAGHMTARHSQGNGVNRATGTKTTPDWWPPLPKSLQKLILLLFKLILIVLCSNFASRCHLELFRN